MGNFDVPKVWWGAIPIGGGQLPSPCPYGSDGTGTGTIRSEENKLNAANDTILDVPSPVGGPKVSPHEQKQAPSKPGSKQ